MLVQIEEVMCAIRALPFVTKLSPVGARNSHGHGYQVSLRCSSCEEYGSHGKKQDPPVPVSSRHSTELAYLKELIKRLKDRYVECAEAVAKKGSVFCSYGTSDKMVCSFQNQLSVREHFWVDPRHSLFIQPLVCDRNKFPVNVWCVDDDVTK
jgi:hypothetical protein